MVEIIFLRGIVFTLVLNYMNFKRYSQSHRTGLDQLMRNKGMVDATHFHEIKSSIPSSLNVIGAPDTPNRQMNCHGFTFGKGAWFETPNVYNLLREGDLIELLQPKQNCIILYINTERAVPIIFHSGIYLGNGTVRSKWSNGPIFEHKIFDSPYSYGENVKFYEIH